MRVEPYLMFDGRCEEAINFYKQAVGAEVEMIMRNSESPDGTGCVPGADDKIMHSSFKVGETRLMASDGYCKGNPKFEGITLAIQAPNVERGKKLFAALGEGGQVLQPFDKTFFSPGFGMVADKFGLNWMVVTEQPCGQQGA